MLGTASRASGPPASPARLFAVPRDETGPRLVSGPNGARRYLEQPSRQWDDAYGRLRAFVEE